MKSSFAAGRMPVVLELHLTEKDRDGYLQLRSRFLRESPALPRLALLGQYMRLLDADDPELGDAERTLARKLQTYADVLNGGKVDLIALDDGARGRASLDNAIAAELLAGLGVDPARLLANVVARNRFPHQVTERLRHFAELGLRNALLLTGDLPAEPGARAVFPQDSIGMCALARRMIIDGALPENFLICAAGHPNPQSDPEGLRALQKVQAGARVLITQAIFHVERFAQWMDSLRRLGVTDVAHVLAEVIPIVSPSQLDVLADIPGIAVPPDLRAEMETTRTRLKSMAAAGGHDDVWIRQRLALEGAKLTRNLFHRVRGVGGVSGFYLGCVRSFAAHEELLKETPLVPEHAESLNRPVKLVGQERQVALAQMPVVEKKLKDMHRGFRRRRESVAGRALRKLAALPVTESALRVLEWPKTPIFGCRHCDRCDLSVDALVCPRGCAKQMSHGPCGAPHAVHGKIMCEDTSRECTWARIDDRRRALRIPLARQIEVRQAPSPEFFAGKRFSAFVPVLAGNKAAPDWGLAVAAPWLGIQRAFGRPPQRFAAATSIDLLTLVESKREDVRLLIDERPDIGDEELLLKVLALVGTPAALLLIEARLAATGVPAEGVTADMSIRELFQLAEALPAVLPTPPVTCASGSTSRFGELSRVLREGNALRKAMRRELAGSIIRHLAGLGARVTYTDTLLDGRFVEPFLRALGLISEELPIARAHGNLEPIAISIRFERVHYRHHYRPAIAVRRFLDTQARTRPRAEFVVDLKQFNDAESFRGELRAALEGLSEPQETEDDAMMLEPFGPESGSVCWALNRVFWRRLDDFEKAKNIAYDDSIGGSTDHNTEYVRSTARAFHDRAVSQADDGKPLYVVEVGVASTQRARTFLDELQRISNLTDSGCYERTTYVLTDYSRELLDRALPEVQAVHASVEAVQMNAADPAAALKPYHGRVMQIHICNVFDNLPSDKVARIDGTLYRLESRLFLPQADWDGLLAKHHLSAAERDTLTELLTAMRTGGDRGVDELLDAARRSFRSRGESEWRYVDFWMDLCAALRAEERYVEIDERESGMPRVPGVEQWAPLLARILPPDRDIEVHLNQEALASFIRLVATLHTAGTLEVVDLFVQRIEEYQDRFKGPAKYDGSTVNWLNGPLFRAVGEAHGARVRFHSFQPFDPRSASVIMLASRS